MGRLLDAWRDAWQAADRSLPAPLKSAARYQVIGPDVVEERGIEKHHPVRPPEKWKRVTILGGTVYINGHDSVKSLRECPDCAALVVDDAWALDVHRRSHPAAAAEVELTEETA